MELAVPYTVLVIDPSGPVPTPPDLPSPALSQRQARERLSLRCILVNEARLKTDTYCAACGERIGSSYVRQIGTRKTFCDFGCYQDFDNWCAKWTVDSTAARSMAAQIRSLQMEPRGAP